MTKGDRPEHTAPPEIFYNEDEARKYTTNSRMIAIQVPQALEVIHLGKSWGASPSIIPGTLVRHCCCLQAQLTERALELLALPDDGHSKLLLDLGCGSGLSGTALTEEGHMWVVRARAAAIPWCT